MQQVSGVLVKYYSFATVITLAVFLAVGLHSGVAALWPVFILALIEITFSFDNAVLNSEILGHMSTMWRKLFLTVGIIVAVFGVRLVMPLILVSLTAHTGVKSVLDMALHNPDEYAVRLHEGYPLIAAFGGMFLLMIGLNFLSEDRETKWLDTVENLLSRKKQPWLVPITGALVALGLIGFWLQPHHPKLVGAALLGASTFVILNLISTTMESRQKTLKAANLGIVGFLYLEILDASFSFDGVIAAFAITKDVVLISAGLGIGALYVRSITVHLLEANTLKAYRYLYHGAHYAILLLGIILLLELKFELPEWLTGLSGITLIGLSLYSSIKHNQRHLKQRS